VAFKLQAIMKHVPARPVFPPDPGGSMAGMIVDGAGEAGR
jgi:hypothetical protein